MMKLNRITPEPASLAAYRRLSDRITRHIEHDNDTAPQSEDAVIFDHQRDNRDSKERKQQEKEQPAQRSEPEKTAAEEAPGSALNIRI
jgi:hypothetical protein